MDVVHFDVLAQPGSDLAKRQPDANGIHLWRMLHEQTIGRVAVVIDGPVDRPMIEHWLKLNGIKAAFYEILDDYLTVEERAERIASLYNSWGRQGWFYVPDPVVAAHTLRNGIPTMLVSNPYIVRPEWSSLNKSSVPRAWDDLVSEVNRQATMKAEKSWREE